MVKTVYSYMDYSFIMEELKVDQKISWEYILLIVIVVSLFIIGSGCLIIWMVRNRSSLFDLGKYKRIDEKNILAQN